MKVTVVGKTTRSGVSKKTGKDYSGVVAYFTAPEDGVDGAAVGDVWLDPVKYPLNSIVLGKTYNLEFNNKGFPVAFTPL